MKKSVAVNSAKTYLDKRFSSDEISKHFIADSLFSFFIYEDYKMFFNSNPISCLPLGFEVGFHVLLSNGKSWDTLESHLFIPLDSSYLVLNDSLADLLNYSFFNAWEKVITGKYKVNYSDVLLFIKQKGFQSYSIDFWYEAGQKPNYKFYWFVIEKDKRGKDKRSVLYRIDSETGAVKVKKLRPLSRVEEVLDNSSPLSTKEL